MLDVYFAEAMEPDENLEVEYCHLGKDLTTDDSSLIEDL